MNTGIKITVLADNTVVARNARGEHGLAFWLETGNIRLLFDTGQGLTLVDNARALGIDLNEVNAIVLSHGHYDHTGGLAVVLCERATPVTVQTHPDALLPKYQRGTAEIRDIGMPAESRKAIFEARCRLVPTRVSGEIAPGIYTTGEIPRRHPEEAVTGSFCRDAEGCEPDLIPDDQALFIQTEPGTIVLLGCAHSGVINTLDHVQNITGGKPLHAVIGGMHLRSATKNRIDWTLQELYRFNIKMLAPLHCTGWKAGAALWTAFPEVTREAGAGAVFEFQKRDNVQMLMPA